MDSINWLTFTSLLEPISVLKLTIFLASHAVQARHKLKNGFFQLIEISDFLIREYITRQIHTFDNVWSI